MPPKTPEVIKETIIRFLAQHPHEQFKPRSLARRLSIKGQEEYSAFLGALNELHQVQSVSREKRKRYTHAVPPSAQHVVGTLTRLDNGSGIVRISDAGGTTVRIPPSFLGTALDGDTVTIAVFAKTSGSAESSQQREQMPEGEIVRVLERRQNPVVGTVKKSKHFFYVVPDSRKVNQHISIPKGKTMGARPGQRVTAVITSWDSPDVNPEGKITEILGRAGEIHTEIAAIAREFHLPLQFPQAVMSEVATIPEIIPQREYKNRIDLRGLAAFTIDPEDAKDFDDAVSLDILPNGYYRLGVHIADVSYFVREGSVLDTEALSRGTSVYLTNGVIPMLPEKLSNDLCSLKEGADRLTYSVFMNISEQGVVREYECVKSMINNKRRFTYEQAQRIIDTDTGDFTGTLRNMHKLSKILYHKRIKEGSIDFESAETIFRFDKDGKPTEIIKKIRLDSHRLVEEFMLAANQTVAKHIARQKDRSQAPPFIYRIHEPPPPAKLSDFISLVEHLGYSLNTRGGITPNAIQKLLDEVRHTEEENLINEVAIRSMSKALYSEKNAGHFGLGFKFYTHFTSPIRRYPDLIVHRLLSEFDQPITKARRSHLASVLPDICERASETERIAMEAERSSVKVMQIEYMKRHIGDEFSAIITGVTAFGLFVKITDYLVEGLVHVRDLEDDYYTFNEKHLSLIGRKSKKRYRLGDKVTVRVVRVNPERQQIDFILRE